MYLIEIVLLNNDNDNDNDNDNENDNDNDNNNNISDAGDSLGSMWKAGL